MDHGNLYETVMSFTWKKLLPGLRRDDEKHWSHARRQAALRELEERFHLHLTEEEVFQAASLFLALLSQGVFIDRDAVTQEVHRQLATYHDLMGKEGRAG
jgi:hypothetical protein